jgi:prepilin-type N-terminal cleavage/methylation domain-containing protein
MVLPTPRLKLMKKNTSAYTLIELIVVIGIMAVILGIGLAGWTSYQNKEKLRTETQRVATWLRKIHTKALQGEKPSTNCNTLDYYQINFDSGTNTFSADAECINPSNTVSAGTLTLTDGVDGSLSQSFYFLSNTGVTEIDPADTIDIDLEFASNTSTITVTYSGKISWEMN